MSVSIVVPAYNAAAYLRATLESALEQSAPAVDVIVIDDGSTDATAEIAKSFGQRITYFHQKNAGVTAARNFALNHVRTEWVLFLDADDLLLSDALSDFQRTRLTAPQSGVVYGQSICFRESDETRFVYGGSASVGPVPTASKVSFWQSAIATPGAAMIRRDVLEAVDGFPADIQIVGDRYFWMKAGTVTEFAFTGGPVLQKRLHDQNMSANLNGRWIEGAQAQLRFLKWCESRGVAVDQFPGESEIFERDIARALEARSFPAVRWLLDEAERRGIERQGIDFARQLLARPAWWFPLELALRQRLRLLPARPAALQTAHTSA